MNMKLLKVFIGLWFFILSYSAVAIDCNESKGVCTIELPSVERVKEVAAKYSDNVQLINSDGKQLVLITLNPDSDDNIISFVTKNHIYILKVKFTPTGNSNPALKSWVGNTVGLTMVGS